MGDQNMANLGKQYGNSGRMPALVILAFGLVYVVWGSTYLAMRIGVETFPPVLLAGVRFLIVGLLLYPVLRWRTRERPTGAQWLTASVSGVLLFVANGWVCVAEKTVPSGVAALLVATVSLWMVLVEWLRPGGVRPSPRVATGIVLGFAGLVFLVGPAHLGGSGRIDPIGSGILVVCSLSWACGSLYAKHGVLPKSPLMGVGMQCLAGGLALCVLAYLKSEVAAFHFHEITLRSWLALGYLITFGSMIGFTSFLYILKNSTAARVGTYAFVNPVVALFLGWLMAGENITPRTVGASAIILTSVVLVISAPQKKTTVATESLPAPSEA
jgi:drug/metabolite transporter (DMT)-like permease